MKESIIINEIFCVSFKFLTALYCSEYLFAFMRMMLFRLIFGFISNSLFVENVFSVSINIIFPCVAAVFCKQRVVFPDPGGP